jgi:voltage-gated potassium channel
MELVRKRALWFLAAMLILLAVGTVGFAWIDRYDWFDALYMSVITLTTVGYYEVKALSTGGRVFNMIYLLLGVNTILFGVGMMTSTIFELQLDRYFARRKTKKMIDSLERHYIICGFGRVGRGAANELKRSGAQFVVVDNSEERIEMVMRGGMLGVLADASRDETLREVRIDRARGLIAALPSDADNLFLTLSAKTLNPMLNVAARANEEEAEAKMRRAGADSVFSPYGFTGSRLAQSILRPHVTQFLDYATLDASVDLGIEQLRIEEGSEFARRSLRDMKVLRQQYGVSVLALRRSEGRMIFNPGPDEQVQPGDHLIVMGPSTSLKQLESVVVAEKRS